MAADSVRVETAEKKQRLLDFIRSHYGSLANYTRAMVRMRGVKDGAPQFNAQVNNERTTITRIINADRNDARHSISFELLRRITRETNISPADLIARIIGEVSDPVDKVTHESVLQDSSTTHALEPTTDVSVTAPVSLGEKADGSFRVEIDEPVIDFVGRENETRNIAEALCSQDGCRTAVIHGMAGIGKTQLALNVAYKIRSYFPDGRILVTLQSDSGQARGRDEVILDALHQLKGGRFENPPSDLLPGFYRAAMSRRSVLIVADNAADANQVKWLIPPRGSALLVTSREKLAMPEGSFFVRPGELQPHEALSLIKRVCERIPDQIADILVKLCGYLPLAIRAAGSLLKIHDDIDCRAYANEMADENHRLELIGSTGVSIGLEASFNLSFARLGEDSSALFIQLANFPESFDAPALAACFSAVAQTCISDLVKRGLVNYSESTRRYRLHDLMRLFARRLLMNCKDCAETQRMFRVKFAKHFLRILEIADRRYCAEDESLSEGLAIVSKESHNILSAWHWLSSVSNASYEELELCSHFGALGHSVIARTVPMAERMKLYRASEGASNVLRSSRGLAGSLYGQAQALSNSHEQTSIHEAIVLFEEVLKLTKDFRLRANVLNRIGNAYLALEPTKPHVACLYHEEALEPAKESGDVGLYARAIGRFAMTCFTNYEQAKARERFAEALALCGHEHKRPRIYILNFMGQMEVKLRNLGARALLEEARTLAIEIKDKGGESAALAQLGRLAMDVDPKRALEMFRRSLQINEELTNPRRIAGAHWDIGRACVRLGNVDDARGAVEACLEISKELGWRSKVSECQQLLSKLP